MPSSVWSPLQLRAMVLENRFVHTAVGEAAADKDGNATPQLRDRYALLGYGGAIGLIITGHTYVAPQGKMRVGQTGIWNDGQIKGLAQVARAARRDGSKIALQLSHGGIAVQPEICGFSPAGASPLDMEHVARPNRAMTLEEIEQLRDQFAEAARRAAEAGFDAVQLHMAHGFGLCQFLSPFFNRRADAYGGSPENRARLAVEIVRAIRQKVGDAFPVLAKINGRDAGLPGGQTLDESIRQARLLEQARLDGLEISGGCCIVHSPTTGPSRPLNKKMGDMRYFIDDVRAFRKVLQIPLTLVGGVRTLAQAQETVQQNEADLVGVCRPLICEPDLLFRWRKGETDTCRCVSCSRCMGTQATGLVHCPQKL